MSSFSTSLLVSSIFLERNLDWNLFWKFHLNITWVFNQRDLEKTFICIWDFPGGSVVKNPPAKKEMWVQSLGWDDPLEEEMATYSILHSWRIPWTEEPHRLQFMGSQRVRHNWATEHKSSVSPPPILAAPPRGLLLWDAPLPSLASDHYLGRNHAF